MQCWRVCGQAILDVSGIVCFSYQDTAMKNCIQRIWLKRVPSQSYNVEALQLERTKSICGLQLGFNQAQVLDHLMWESTIPSLENRMETSQIGKSHHIGLLKIIMKEQIYNGLERYGCITTLDPQFHLSSRLLPLGKEIHSAISRWRRSYFITRRKESSLTEWDAAPWCNRRHNVL